VNKMPGYIHHVQWCVTSLDETLHKLTQNYRFNLLCERNGMNKEAVVKCGDIVFLLTERGTEVIECEKSEYPWLTCSCRNCDRHLVDSVFNVCLEVGDVDKVFTSMTSNGSEVFKNPSTIVTPEGCLRVAVVGSPCKNVIHSLVNTSQYNGLFLPGFGEVASNEISKEEEDKNMFTHMDHVTYVCEVGDSRRILDWYNKCCGMERFLAPLETPGEGVVIEDDVGMRLMAGEWLSEWLCREEGVMWNKKGDGGGDSKITQRRNFKLVMAEPLPDNPTSHVNSFLEAHGGPGLQHIGLSTDRLASCVADLTQAGAQFRKPPPTYYKLEGKVQEILDVGEDPEIFKNLGILIDPEPTEANFFVDEPSQNYILQLFSYPIFEQNTFFLEVIHRQGSRGFGAGNIRALAQSIIELEKQRQELISKALTALSVSKSVRSLEKSASQPSFYGTSFVDTRCLRKCSLQLSFSTDSLGQQCS